MIELRPFSSLGGADHGWLRARHHFSFADYYDPARMSWGTLRVWNDDEIQPGTGFPPHSHTDMEIVTYVREGAITHRDDLGNEGRTLAGDVQTMSAGAGIRHSEYNFEGGVTKIFQIWILPTSRGGAPQWGTRPFPKQDRAVTWIVLASGLPEDVGALPIRADARVVGAYLPHGATLDYNFAARRRGYLVPATGALDVLGSRVGARDGVAIAQCSELTIKALEPSELLLVDVPGTAEK